MAELFNGDIVLSASPGYIILFDDSRVDEFCIRFNTVTSIGGSINSASVELLYSESFLEIEFLTDVRIFVKNIFTEKFKLVFEGQIRSRQLNLSNTQKSIIFNVTDYMAWLPKIPVPILFGLIDTIDPLETFTWLAKGINYPKVSSILTQGQTAFAGLTLRGVVEKIFTIIGDSTILGGATTDNTTAVNSVYFWTGIAKRIKVDSDIFADLLPNNVVDFYFQGALVKDIYTLLSNIVQKIGFEMYQSYNGLIHIKEPMWFDIIPKQNIIDPILISNFSESTNWDQQVSRVIVTGGIEPVLEREATKTNTQAFYTPAGVFVGLDAKDSSAVGGIFLDINQVNNLTGMDINSPGDVNTAGSLPNAVGVVTEGRAKVLGYAQDIARQGIRYQWGGETITGGMDCSGFVYYCFYNAGYSIIRTTAEGYYQQSTKITAGQLQPGDLGFLYSKGEMSHIGIFMGDNTWAEASSVQGKVVIRQTPNCSNWQYYGAIAEVVSGDTGRAVTVSPPSGDLYPKLNDMTDRERKYGVNVLEIQQPLIRVGIQSTADQKSNAYKELGRYSEYIYHTQNAQTNIASINLTAAPWLLPGYNCLVDPLGLNRVYYVTSVSHSGDASGVSTTANLTYGRSWEEYKANFSTVGTGASKSSDRIDKNRFTDRETVGISVTAKDNIPSESIDPSTGDRDKCAKLLRDYASKYSGEGAVPASATNYKSFWGESLAQQGYSMNRWDFQFTAAEILLMLTFTYGTQGSSGVRASLMGPIAKNYLTSDSQFNSMPQVVKDRAIGVAASVAKAKVEIAIRYIKQEEVREVWE